MDFSVRFPEDAGSLSQDEEFIILEGKDGSRTVRCHDYHELYSIPGLYEHLFYEKLKCCSPKKVCSLLENELEKSPVDPADLIVLDLGAGNGMVGEELANIGAKSIVGVDIIGEAREAVVRDRPEVYDDYLVTDFTSLDKDTRESLGNRGFNCLTTVAALGFGDIPPVAFAEGFNFVEDEGWVAFNIKEEFLDKSGASPFSELVEEMLKTDVLRLHKQETYRHRLSIDGTPLYYVAMVGTKHGEFPVQDIISG